MVVNDNAGLQVKRGALKCIAGKPVSLLQGSGGSRNAGNF